MKILCLDCETTGLPPKGWDYKIDYMKSPRILSLAWKINDEAVKERIINQEGRIVPLEATKINGITQEMVDKSPDHFGSVIQELIVDACDNDYTIGHNLFFDTSLIKANVLLLWQLDQTNFNTITEILHKDKRIDTMRAGTKLCGKWPKLTELYFELFRTTYAAHSAGADCEACYRCFTKMLELGLIKYPEPKPIEVVVEKATDI